MFKNKHSKVKMPFFLPNSKFSFKNIFNLFWSLKKSRKQKQFITDIVTLYDISKALSLLLMSFLQQITSLKLITYKFYINIIKLLNKKFEKFLTKSF